MPSFLEKEQLTPVAPYIAPADQILNAFNTKQSLFGIGASQVNSTYNAYSNMQLTNGQNQQQLDGLMKTAGTELKSASMKDLSVGDNQSAALSVFDPILKDQDIMGDSALTKSWNQSRQMAESARISSGGKSYNPDSIRAVNAQQALFSRSDKSTWKTFYNNKESYNPYYDEQGERDKLTKGFKTDIVDVDSQKGAYITTTKNSSWYKDKWQQYFEATASPQLKAQVAQRGRADYYTDMLTMPKEAIVQKYTDMRNNLINKQIGVDYSNLMNKVAQLSIKTNSKDNAGIRAELSAQANYLNNAIDAKKAILKTPLEGADSIGTVEGLATGTRVAEGLAQYQYYDKIGDAFAHKEEKFSIKPDYGYISLVKIKEQSREFGIRESEVHRHNVADETHNTNMEGIDMLKAQADLIRANKTKGGAGEEDNPTNQGGAGTDASYPSANVNAKSDPATTVDRGKTILDNLSHVQDKYNEVYDQVSSNIFSKNIMGEIDKMVLDPNKQNMTLKDIADPTRGSDGTGGNSERLAKFLVAAGVLDDSDAGRVISSLLGDTSKYDPMEEAMSMPLSQVKQTLRQIWSDPAMFKKAMEGIKTNDPSVTSFGISAQLEKMKQRIDGEHGDIVSQAITPLRTNLGDYAKLFEADYFSKGKIPTRDEVRAKMEEVPTSTLENELKAGDITIGAKFQHQIGLKSKDDIFRDAKTDQIMQNILGTLGNNRTAYNSNQKDYIPIKGNTKSDVEFQKNLQILIEGAEGDTKGNSGTGVAATLDYARKYPSAVSRVTMHGVDEGHDVPYMQIFFKEPTNSFEKAEMPKGGVPIYTTNANDRFRQQPLDDKTLLLNNKSLKFQTQYADGTKTNLSIYNASGDQSNPQFDINQEFSYKSLDVDNMGNIKGVITIHKADEINNITRGRPDLFPLAINENPTAIYNTLADKLIKNRELVNAYLDAQNTPHPIMNIKDLPENLKNALKNNSF